MYGEELIIDMKGCDISKFTRDSLKEYFEQICDLIEMERCDLHFWMMRECPKKINKLSLMLKASQPCSLLLRAI